MLAAFKQGKNEADEFNWEEADNVPGIEIPGLAPAEPQGIPISDKVNQTDAKALQEMGFSKNVSEKALFMT